MRRFLFITILFMSLSLLLMGCANSSGPASTLEEYLKALVEKDSARMSVLSCSDWQQQSQQLLDSFTAVETKLSSLACKEIENDGSTSSVNCTGNITATYNGENQELDLSTMTFILAKQKGDWLICGQK